MAVFQNDIQRFLVFFDVMSSLGEISNGGDFSVADRLTPACFAEVAELRKTKRLWPTDVLRNDVWVFRGLLIVYLEKLIVNYC